MDSNSTLRRSEDRAHALVQRALISRHTIVADLSAVWRSGACVEALNEAAAACSGGGGTAAGAAVAADAAAALTLASLRPWVRGAPPGERAAALALSCAALALATRLLACDSNSRVYEDHLAAGAHAATLALRALRALQGCACDCDAAVAADAAAAAAAAAQVRAALARATALLSHGGGGSGGGGSSDACVAVAAELSAW
jgi:hypothetical protein